MLSENKISKITFIGSGNVAWGLAPFFLNNEIEITEIFSTNKSTSNEFANKFNCKPASSLTTLDKNSDMYLFAIPDKEIAEVARDFPDVNGIVAHTSGIVPINVLKRFNKYGVFYPLQTFSKGLAVDICKVPFCIEASDEVVEKELYSLASKLSNNVHLINSEQRKKLHLSAVLVSNFSNLLYNYANELLEEEGIDFKLLIPLMEESVRKMQFLKPHDAQTGPAKRNDKNTIEEHLRMLESYPEIQNLYKLLSEQIRTRYHE